VPNFKHGAIVHWKSSRESSGYVQDAKGIPQKFVVISPRRKYCILRSLDLYKSGHSFQDLRSFDMSNLVPVDSFYSGKQNSDSPTKGEK